MEKKREKKGGREGGRERGRKERKGREEALSLKLRLHTPWCSASFSQAPSTVLITSLTATLIALAKELGTCKQLTLISQQVISLKEC